MTSGAGATYRAPCPACGLLAAVAPVGDAATSCVWQVAHHNKVSDDSRCVGGGDYIPRHMVWDAGTRSWLASSSPAPAAIVDGVTVYVTGSGRILYHVKVSAAPDGWHYFVGSEAGGVEGGRIPAAADASTMAGILADVIRFALRSRP